MKKSMKKVIAIVCVLTMLAAILTACGGKDDKNTGSG